MNNSIIKVILSILLLLCLINMPYGYYQFVRFAAMVGFAYLEYSAKERSSKNEMFVYSDLALLFQPLFKIVLDRIIWNVVDVVVATGLLLSVAFQSKTKLKH